MPSRGDLEEASLRTQTGEAHSEIWRSNTRPRQLKQSISLHLWFAKPVALYPAFLAHSRHANYMLPARAHDKVKGDAQVDAPSIRRTGRTLSLAGANNYMVVDQPVGQCGSCLKWVAESYVLPLQSIITMCNHVCVHIYIYIYIIAPAMTAVGHPCPLRAAP